jgi:hypothetical protein
LTRRLAGVPRTHSPRRAALSGQGPAQGGQRDRGTRCGLQQPLLRRSRGGVE